MNSQNVLKEKSFLFAVRIVRLAEYLKKNHKAFELASQIFRSGTAIGALVREAEYAESKKDFIHKLHIALKEANETEFWLDLSCNTSLITKRIFDSIKADIKELLRILISIIKTSKSRLNSQIG